MPPVASELRASTRNAMRRLRRSLRFWAMRLGRKPSSVMWRWTSSRVAGDTRDGFLITFEIVW